MIRLLADFVLRSRCRWVFWLGAACSSLRAELQVTPAEIDLGRHRQEQTVTSTVRLTNSGPTVVKIIRVGADCSCTAATPSRTTLAPGESTEMKVSFETHSSQGEVRRRISVLTSEGELVVPLKVIVSAYDDWTLSSAMAILPPTNKGQPGEGEFTVTFTGSGSADLKDLSSAAEWLRASIAEHHDNIWKIKLLKAAEAPAGNLQPKLIVHTTDAHEPKLEIDVFASVYSVLKVQPNPIVLPPTKVGTLTSLPVTISGWDPKVDPRGEIMDGKFTMQQRDHKEVLMKLEVTPQKIGTSTRLLSIYTGQSLEAEVPVIIRADE